MRVILFSVLFFSSSLFAHGLKLGSLYSFNFGHRSYDNGDYDDGYLGAQGKETGMQLNLGFTLDGQFNDDWSFTSMVQFTTKNISKYAADNSKDCLGNQKKSTTAFLAYAYTGYTLNDTFSFRVGCMRMNSGGYYERARGISRVMQDNPAQGMANPVKRFDNALEANFTHKWGNLSLQIADDKSDNQGTSSTGQGNNEGTHGTPRPHAHFQRNLEAKGWGLSYHLGIEPTFIKFVDLLIQAGSYDRGEASYWSFGFSKEYKGFSFVGDYQMNRFLHRDLGGTGTPGKGRDHVYGWNAKLTYNNFDMASPYIAYSKVSRNKLVSLNGHANSFSTTKGLFDNNARVYSFGVTRELSSGFSAYFAYDELRHLAIQSQADAANGVEDTHREATWKIGFTSSI